MFEGNPLTTAPTGSVGTEVGVSLAKAVKAGRPITHTGRPCSVGQLLDQLETSAPDEHTALLEMLGTQELRGWSAADIYDTLRAHDYHVGLQTINRHRGRKCKCAQ